MRKLKLFSPIFLLASIILGFGCTDINKNAYSGHNSFFYNDSLNFSVVNHDDFKVDSISQLSKEINRIEMTQNGVCDTCITGYQSAIIENRKVAEKLSNETAELQRKVWAVQKQIQAVDSVLSSNDVQLSKLRAINVMAKRETNKQKHEYYALTKGD